MVTLPDLTTPSGIPKTVGVEADGCEQVAQDLMVDRAAIYSSNRVCHRRAGGQTHLRTAIHIVSK